MLFLTMEMLPLRADVELEHLPGVLRVRDRATGLQIEISSAEDAGEADLTGLSDELSSLGLLEEGLSLAEIRGRQRSAGQEALRTLQLERIRELLAFACEKIPYYRSRRATFGPEVIGSYDDFERLPLMHKADIREGFPGGLLADGVDVPALLASGDLAIATTSGSTGERIQVLADMNIATYPEGYASLWALHDVPVVPKTAVFASPTCMGTECHLGEMSYEQRLKAGNTLFLNSTSDLFTLDRGLVEQIAEELERLQPTFFYANPVYLHWLGRRAQAFGVRLPRPRAILSSYQLLPRASRRAITELFEAPVYDFYAASELGCCRGAVECRLGRNHVRADHAHVEVLRDGRLAATGEIGSVVVTTLATRVMPLVRYLIGDLGRMTGEACDCELAEWPCFELHGRVKDALRLHGRWVTSREIDEVVGAVPGVDFYRCTQTGESELSLLVIPAPGERLEANRLADRLREVLGVARTSVREVARLDPEPSLKFRLTECRIAQPPEAL